MTPLERAIADGDLPRAQSIQAAKARAKASARARRKSRSPRAPGKTQGERRAETLADRRPVYEAVRERDAGLCTVQLAVMGECSGALHIDHQWGRGKEPTQLENCRDLCARHDRMKTDGDPNRLLWLCDFREWATLHGYREEAEKAERQIALERAQHPNPKAPTEPIRLEVRDA